LRPWPCLSGPPGDRPNGRAWDLPVLAHGESTHAKVLRPRGVRLQLAHSAAGDVAFRLWRQRRHPGKCDYAAQCPGLHVPRPTLRLCPCGRRRTAWGHRGSLHLRCRALSSPPPCRFIPAHPHFRGQPSDRSTPTTPEGSSVPASGSLAPSLAFAVPIAARLPLGPASRQVCMTTLVRPRNIALATDRSVVPPRFAPGISTTHGGVPIGDPDVSPSQTFPGWLPQFSLFTSCHRDHSSCHGAQADGHTVELQAPAGIVQVNAAQALTVTDLAERRGGRDRKPSLPTQEPADLTNRLQLWHIALQEEPAHRPARQRRVLPQ
jgi:hypothetical protein